MSAVMLSQQTKLKGLLYENNYTQRSKHRTAFKRPIAGFWKECVETLLRVPNTYPVVPIGRYVGVAVSEGNKLMLNEFEISYIKRLNGNWWEL